MVLLQRETGLLMKGKERLLKKGGPEDPLFNDEPLHLVLNFSADTGQSHKPGTK